VYGIGATEYSTPYVAPHTEERPLMIPAAPGNGFTDTFNTVGAAAVQPVVMV
jgi:hypothetical protein